MHLAIPFFAPKRAATSKSKRQGARNMHQEIVTSSENVCEALLKEAIETITSPEKNPSGQWRRGDDWVVLELDKRFKTMGSSRS
ncbi:MAG: hypothetical protein VYA34_13360 [Myxococcota bacterium]|nr:hypothetical protein [Myxococcota bacterium]